MDGVSALDSFGRRVSNLGQSAVRDTLTGARAELTGPVSLITMFGRGGLRVGETPPFDESLASFLRFAGSEGFSTDLVWVFREDVTNCVRDYWVRVPVPAGNAALARDYFEYGRRQGRGVTLEVLCRLGGRSACFVWVPEDDEAASYAMQGPLKLKVPIHPVEASAVRSGLVWRWLRWYHRWRHCVRFAELLPLREEAERRASRCT